MKLGHLVAQLSRLLSERPELEHAQVVHVSDEYTSSIGGVRVVKTRDFPRAEWRPVPTGEVAIALFQHPEDLERDR